MSQTQTQKVQTQAPSQSREGFSAIVEKVLMGAIEQATLSPYFGTKTNELYIDGKKIYSTWIKDGLIQVEAQGKDVFLDVHPLLTKLVKKAVETIQGLERKIKALEESKEALFSTLVSALQGYETEEYDLNIKEEREQFQEKADKIAEEAEEIHYYRDEDASGYTKIAVYETNDKYVVIEEFANDTGDWYGTIYHIPK